MATRKTAKQTTKAAAPARSRKPSRAKTKAAAPAVDPAECAHSWQIDRPDSQISKGTCSKCGSEKEFLNYGEELRMPFGRRRRSS